MPTLYITGLGPAGKSCVLKQQELSPEGDVFEALRFGAAATQLPEGGESAMLLESPTSPGGSVYNIYPWRPGQRTPMHRTITIDVDVVLQGSLLMELESEEVELRVGDCVIIPGIPHAWVSGPDGAVVLYNLVAASPTGADIGRRTRPLM